MTKDQIKRNLILEMMSEYESGGNAMALARKYQTDARNSVFATMVAYDLQAGSYVAAARKNIPYRRAWANQLQDCLRPYVTSGASVMEVGVGEATTLSFVADCFTDLNPTYLGFDISWSRLSVGKKFLEENDKAPNLFVGDLFSIPLASDSVDVIYTSHSLEPNGGAEVPAIKELLRVARTAVVLIEPMYELASDQAKERMNSHGYVKGLKCVAEELGAVVERYDLLDIVGNELNPSGVLALRKSKGAGTSTVCGSLAWQCPLTGAAMLDCGSYFYAKDTGIAYPKLSDIPLLTPSNAVIATKLDM